MNCAERQDQILLYAAGVLERAEEGELRAHLATGCPRCAGVLSAAEATLAQLAEGLSKAAPPLELRNKILNQATKLVELPKPASYHLRWEKIVIPSAVAAVLAVGITLFSVRYLSPRAGQPVATSQDVQRMGALEAMVADSQGKLAEASGQTSLLETTLAKTQGELDSATKALQGMKVASMAGDAQPSATAHVFLDMNHKKWYFFTNGMKPPADGKTYEFWVCVGTDKLPAGTFEVSDNGTATLNGSIPPIPAGANVMLCVTDEPMGGTKVPTGSSQLMGTVE